MDIRVIKNPLFANSNNSSNMNISPPRPRNNRTFKLKRSVGKRNLLSNTRTRFRAENATSLNNNRGVVNTKLIGRNRSWSNKNLRNSRLSGPRNQRGLANVPLNLKEAKVFANIHGSSNTPENMYNKIGKANISPASKEKLMKHVYFLYTNN